MTRTDQSDWTMTLIGDFDWANGSVILNRDWPKPIYEEEEMQRKRRRRIVSAD